MPKRIIHGEGVWESTKLGKVKPLWVRPEYANLLPLALANGVFEIHAKRIWSRVYSFNRPEINVRKVRTILKSLRKVGLLFLWTENGGKQYGWWTGIDKPGRLPGESRRGTNEMIGPTPPEEELRMYLESHGIQMFLGSGIGIGNKGQGKVRIPEESVSGCPEKGCGKPVPKGFRLCKDHVLLYRHKGKKK